MEQDLYKKLTERKSKGEKLDWNNITKEELEELFENNSDNMIAELYGVTKSQVTTKRRKWDIKLINYTFKNVFKEGFSKNLFDNINQNSKKELLNEDNIDTIAIALTHYLFRNGPVEDMHSEGKLSQEDMKTLNKFMVNRIAGLLETINKGEWLKLELLLDYYSKYFGKHWDKPVADTDEIEMEYKRALALTNNYMSLGDKKN